MSQHPLGILQSHEMHPLAKDRAEHNEPSHFSQRMDMKRSSYVQFIYVYIELGAEMM